MIFKKSLIQKISLITADILSLVLSLIIVTGVLNLIRPGEDIIILNNLGIAKIGGLFLIIIFWYQEQYVKRRPVWEEIRLIAKTIVVFGLFHLGASYLLSHHVIKLLNVLFWITLLFVLPLLRYFFKLILLKLNLWQRCVYIIGLGENAIAAYNLLNVNKILGYKFLGFIDLSEAEGINTININDQSLNVWKKNILLSSIKNGQTADAEIIFAVTTEELLKNSQLINILQTKYAFVSIVPDITGLPLYGVELDHFFGSEHLFLRLQNNLGRRFNRTIKRIMDIMVSLLGIIILLPVFILISLLVKSSTRSRVIFKHKRIGVDGKPFYCMKFQTMYENSQELLNNLLAQDENARKEWEKDFKLRNDPRVTKIGQFLRKTSLDELPQLFNVLKGEMSLVGPRPIIDAELERYAEDAYYYTLVRPGITGLWQISGRNDIDYATRVRLDVYYVKNWSLWYDLVILFKTFFVVLTKSGAY